MLIRRSRLKSVQTGPNGHLFVVSLSNGAVYEIARKPSIDNLEDNREDGSADE